MSWWDEFTSALGGAVEWTETAVGAVWSGTQMGEQQLTFNAVDKAKNNEVTAQHVDYCNFQRHTAKQNFQKKFFNNDLSELKMGYNKYE